MNAQQIFDTVYSGLSAQGFRQSRCKMKSNQSGMDIMACAYRGEGGRKCAVGHLIPDDKYSTELEGKNVTNQEIVELLSEYTVYFRLLRELQCAHDTSLTPQDMKRSLILIADNWRLQHPH